MTNEPDMVKRLRANAAHTRRLRDESPNTVDPWKAGHQCGSAVLADLCDEAASTIETLREEVRAARRWRDPKTDEEVLMMYEIWKQARARTDASGAMGKENGK